MKISLFKVCLTMTISINLVNSIASGVACAALNVDRGELQQVELVKKLNNVIRSNPGDFWISEAFKTWLSKSHYSKFLGPILGDGHIGNVFRIKIGETFRWGPIDYDDLAERGPILAAIAKTIILGKSATNEIKVTASVQAYMDGLKGAPRKQPELVKKLLNIDSGGYMKQLAEYAQGQSKGDKLNERKDFEKISKAQKDSLEEIVENQLPNTKFLDAALMKRATGGSAEAVRFRILAKIDGEKYILDMKEVMGSSLIPVGETANLPAYMQAVFARVFGGDTAFRKIVGYNSRVFTLMLKVEVEGLMEQPPKKEEVQKFVELHLYNMYVQGLYARGSSGGQDLVAAFERDPHVITDEIKKMQKDYLKDVKQRWELALKKDDSGSEESD